VKELDGTEALQVVIPDSFHAVVKGLQYGSERVFDMWFHKGSPAHGTAAELAQLIVNEITENDLPVFQASLTFDSVTVYDTSTVPYTEGTAAFDPGVHGTGTNEPDAPPATAVRVTLKDGLVYRGGKPGFSLPAQAADNVADGVWVTGLIELVAGMVDRFFHLPAGTSGALYLLANKHLRVNKTQVNETVPATTFVVQEPTRTIKRRNVGSGR